MQEYQPKTITEYLANEYNGNGGELNTRANAEYFAEVFYEGLDLGEVDFKNDIVAQYEFELVVRKFEKLIDELTPNFVGLADEWVEDRRNGEGF